ncbi:hypothetical protein C8J56DRAFT_1029107 [Mycena floridula]|nr:hypothetical protein C8J56DRAFT_1029107 [Mycena floridula]
MPRSKTTIGILLKTIKASARATCHICHRTVSRSSDLPRHIASLHNPSPVKAFPCPFAGCNVSVSQKSNLKSHLNIHTGERRKCPDCDFETPDAGSLTRHRKRKHNYIPKARRAKNRWSSPEESDWTSSESSSSSSPSPSPSSNPDRFLLESSTESFSAPEVKAHFDPAALFGPLDLEPVQKVELSTSFYDPATLFDQQSQLQWPEYPVSTSYEVFYGFNQFVASMQSYMSDPMHSFEPMQSYVTEPLQQTSWTYENAYAQVPPFSPYLEGTTGEWLF